MLRYCYNVLSKPSLNSLDSISILNHTQQTSWTFTIYVYNIQNFPMKQVIDLKINVTIISRISKLIYIPVSYNYRNILNCYARNLAST